MERAKEKKRLAKASSRAELDVDREVGIVKTEGQVKKRVGFA